jgi:hypothetical protein
MVSYKELVEIRTAMNGMQSMLTGALALRGDMDKLTRRVHKLELKDARLDGAASARYTMLGYIGGLVTAAIGGGAFLVLPKLWGG